MQTLQGSHNHTRSWKNSSNWIFTAKKRRKHRSSSWGAAKACRQLLSKSDLGGRPFRKGTGDNSSSPVHHPPGQPGQCPFQKLPALSGPLAYGLQQKAAVDTELLRLCHLALKQLQLTKRKNRVSTCLKGITTPPREGMQQQEPRARRLAYQRPTVPEDLFQQPWISNYSRLNSHTCN